MEEDFNFNKWLNSSGYDTEVITKHHKLMLPKLSPFGQLQNMRSRQGFKMILKKKQQTGTKVATLDGSQVLLITLPIASIFIHHVRCPCFNLAVDDGEPQFLCFDRFASPALPLVLFVQFLKLVTPCILKSWRLVGTEQRPLSVCFDLIFKKFIANIPKHGR